MSAEIHYQCQRCGACCRWAGYVRVTEEEIPRIAKFLGLGLEEFIHRYTRLMPKRDGLALLEKPNGECEYFKDGGCMLQAVKPIQCIGFPNTWNFPGWQENCKATPV